MLKEAGEKLGEALAAVTLREIKLPYLANVTADYVREAEAVKPLLKQPGVCTGTLAAVRGASACGWCGYVCGDRPGSYTERIYEKDLKAGRSPGRYCTGIQCGNHG